jgi:hypothetical protein
MGTYDGDVVAWKYMLPYTYISGIESSLAGGDQYYIYQTMLRLPHQWNMTYDSNSGEVEVIVYGSAGMCGQDFDKAQSGQEVGIVLEDSDGNGVEAGEGEPLSRLRA